MSGTEAGIVKPPKIGIPKMTAFFMNARRAFMSSPLAWAVAEGGVPAAPY